ncbi:hypothetical protein [Streptomyces orinoci]|uniref:Sigma-like protein n=1 Tax=Streptomyces orinoci TaxID=67339 RepID=A0ABV3JZB7_STRON|nr:hypothetical protein [Streptomyces orinoci]
MSDENKLKPNLPKPNDDHMGGTTGLAATPLQPTAETNAPAVVQDDHMGSEPV